MHVLSLGSSAGRRARLAALLTATAGIFAASTATFAGDDAKVVPPTADTATTAKAKPAAAAAATLAFTAQLVDGKKSWVPAVANAKAGETYELVLVNKLPEPHGFQIEGLVQPQIVEANKTLTLSVTVPKDKKGDMAINCQLHPAHVGAKLVVQ